MSTKVTVKGQVTLPKAVREAAGIRPGDRVIVRAMPEGGVLVEREGGPRRPSRKIDLEWLRKRRDALPPLGEDAVTIIRRMRDEEDDV